ncbi:uncharacterized protein LY89DRAFT_60751 [Mollisia scopiformis]|uniref:Uncharacterized protein n=1 Tax=Mollisia scopiformis TaxID=149040 RepID=A0A194XC71_MOLSC|nr:uncharacterized protein LY89DRAFT_60751 [Mollisia scopiformis]KUJ17756.1 hypothetical protein LY89DRAFT_60751 [Mollisia scopiformis]
MAVEHSLNGSMPKALPTFNHPTLPRAKTAQSAPDSHRRNSLPLHFLPPSLWSANTSSASLVESEETARGEHILDEATVAHRISALRQLNGATRSRHRYAKSTGARNSTFSQPVIVRTYSGTTRPRSEQRDLVTVKRDGGWSAMSSGKMELKLPPVEAFSFKGIMDEIRHGVTEDLERIAEICARSKYSLSNQYEVHMPPHGRGEPTLQTVGLGVRSQTTGPGPTLQAVPSDDEHPRQVVRGPRRRTKSAAYGTLETIMSSSRSSDEDKSKKKPAAVLAEEVRGRAAKKELQASKDAERDDTNEAGTAEKRPGKHVRSKSASFAAVIIDNAQGSKTDTPAQVLSPTSLVSEPARPQTSTATMLETTSSLEAQYTSPTLQSMVSTKPALIRNESRASAVRPSVDRQSSVLDSLTSWLPWGKLSSAQSPVQGRLRSTSHAEGSLRELLKASEIDKKGKSVDRSE